VVRVDYRHGDMALIAVDELPAGLKASNKKTLMVGSGQNPHTFKGGIFYEFKGHEFIVGYLKAEKTVLYHKDHGENDGKSPKEARVEDRKYEVRRQGEQTHEGMRPVDD
jgi:hypothetical protein